MKHLVPTTLVLAGCLCLSGMMAEAAQARFLCSYQAQISDNDKFNSRGEPVVRGYNKSSVAMAIRQDRANFHKFGLRDPEDTGDCVFHRQDARARLQRMLESGRISSRAMHAIRDGNPVISVDVYDDHVDVRMIGEAGWGGPPPPPPRRPPQRPSHVF